MSMTSHRTPSGVTGFWTQSDASLGGITLFGIGSLREVRAAFISLASWVSARPDYQGLLVIDRPRLERETIRSEVWDLRQVLRESIAQRLFLVFRSPEGGLSGLPPGISASQVSNVAFRSEGAGRRPVGHSYHIIFTTLLRDWLKHERPRSRKELQVITGFTQVPIDRALADLAPWIEKGPRKSVSLRGFPMEAWRRVVTMAPIARESVCFVDRAGIGRSPQSLLKRLRDLNRPAVAVGGVIGAQHYDRSLDLVGTPRVDLTVHQERGDIDYTWIRALDPALERADEIHFGKPSLVVHVLRRRESFFETTQEGMLVADPGECLLDLHELRLHNQIDNLVRALRADTPSWAFTEEMA